MPAWLAPLAISAGSSLLGGLFGGKGEWDMSPEQRKYLEELWKTYRGGTPDWMRQEYQRTAGEAGTKVRNWFGENLPAGTASGAGLATEMQVRAKAMEGLPGEVGRYKTGLLGQIGQASGNQQYRPNTAGQSMGDIGGLLNMILAMKGQPNQQDWWGSIDPSQFFNAYNQSYGNVPQAPWG